MQTSRTLQAIAASCLALGSFLILPVAAAAQPDETTTIEDNESVYPGDTFELVGQGFVPNSTVVLEITTGPIYLGEVTAAADGEIQATIMIPDGTPAGEHTITASGKGPDGPVVIETPVAVNAPMLNNLTNGFKDDEAEAALFGAGSLLALVAVSAAGAGAGLLKRDKPGSRSTPEAPPRAVA